MIVAQKKQADKTKARCAFAPNKHFKEKFEADLVWAMGANDVFTDGKFKQKN